jgi:hypothetical protein
MQIIQYMIIASDSKGFYGTFFQRHYSPKTLKAYSGWVRKLRTYTKSKDQRLVSIDDVKAFLTWPAVDQDIFGKEFGKVDSIVRAKRKPYIPVVLSRE